MRGNWAQISQRLKPYYQNQMSVVTFEHKIIGFCRSVGFSCIRRMGARVFCVGVTTALDWSVIFEEARLCVGLCVGEQVIMNWVSFIAYMFMEYFFLVWAISSLTTDTVTGEMKVLNHSWGIGEKGQCSECSHGFLLLIVKCLEVWFCQFGPAHGLCRRWFDLSQ